MVVDFSPAIILTALTAEKQVEMTFVEFLDTVAKDSVFVSLPYYLSQLKRLPFKGEMGVTVSNDEVVIVIIKEQ